MTLEEIRELIQLVTETGVAELEIQRGDDRVRIRRGVTRRVQDFSAPPRMAAAAAAQDAPAALAARPQSAEPAPPAPAADEPAADASLVAVKSPIVGTFYESASPGAPAFVRIGDSVKPGQVLCIIESMKLMNEIEAEIAGVVMNKLVENAQPVEYGETLFTIRPI